MKDKNNLKKYFVVLLLSFAFVLTGCGKYKIVNTEKPDTNNNTQTENNKSDAIVIPGDDSSIDENNTMKTEKNFSMGEWKNNIYSNDFLDIRFYQPKGWTASTQEEIAEMMDISADKLYNNNADVMLELAKRTTVYYMMSKNEKTGDNVIVMSEKPVMNITMDYYISVLKQQLEDVNNIKYEIIETLDDKLGNKEYKTILVNATMNGVTLMQKYYVSKKGNYFVSIIVTSVNGKSGISDISKYFD